MRKLSTVILSAFLVIQQGARANPSGGTVAAGNATIQNGPNTTTIQQTSNAAIINWQGFSIGKNEATKFLQPGSQSAILNRVTGGNPSQLLGSLQANGRVFLINQHGILIGSSARINTAGFVASSLDVDDSQFMGGGDLKFMGDSKAKVTNLGTVNASTGDIFLIGKEVENKGALNAPKGTAGLAAGSQVLLKRQGDEHLFVDPTRADNTGKVTNSGTIKAAQAELKANGGNLYALAINNTGLVAASGVQKKDGRVYLTAQGGTLQNTGTLTAKKDGGAGGTIVAKAGTAGQVVNSGRISASAEGKNTGGKIEVTGDRVTLKSGSLVQASGATGGGTILIGGGEHGANASVPNAKIVTVEHGATLAADALSDGNGGQVVVWSDEHTVFNGNLSARGGVLGGNGGFAEISGKALSFHGTASLAAPEGSLGTLLFDPQNLIIHEGSGTDSSTDVYEQSLEALTANIVLQADLSIQALANNSATPFTLSLKPNVGFTAEVLGSASSLASIDLTQMKITTTGTGGIQIGTIVNNPQVVTVAVNELKAGSGGISILSGRQFGGFPNGGQIDLHGNLTATGGGITVSSTGTANTTPILLYHDFTVDSGGSDVHFGGFPTKDPSEPSDFAIHIGSAAHPVGNLNLDYGVIFSSSLDIFAHDITSAGPINSTGPINMTVGHGNTITLLSQVDSRTSSQTYVTDYFVLPSDSFAGLNGSSLTLRPATAGGSMSVGGAKDASQLSISGTELSQLEFNSYVFGADGSGEVAVHSGNLRGDVTFAGATQSLDEAFTAPSIHFSGNGTTVLSGSALVNVQGGSATFDNPVILASGARAQVSNDMGAITFNSTIDGPGSLTLVPSGGNIAFLGDIGSTTPLSNLSLYAPGLNVVLPSTHVTNSLAVAGDVFVFNNFPASVTQTGPISAAVLRVSATGNIDLSNPDNQISTLDAVNFGQNFHLNNSQDLFLSGHITGGASSQATVEVHGGSLNLMSAEGTSQGAKITIKGAGNSLSLAADGGVFNNADATVLDVQNGARWVIYVTANDSSHLKLNGLSPTFTNTSTVFPALPSQAGNGLVVGPISGGSTPTTGVQKIIIVAGASGSAAGDTYLDDGQILFNDDTGGTSVTVSVGKLESLSGNVLLQAGQSISLANGLSLDFASVMGSNSVTFQTSAANAKVSLGGNLITGNGSLNLLVGTGALSLRSFNIGSGNATLDAGSLSFATGSTFTATNLSLNILKGIGSSSAPLQTRVATLDAHVNTGGVFISNSGQTLTVGGFNNNIAGISAGAGKIQLSNNASIKITDFQHGARIFGQDDILVKATGATSDIVVASSITGVNAHAGTVTLQAGRDADLGDSATGKFGDVFGKKVTINAGHAIVVDEDSVVTGDNGVTLTAGTVVAAPDSRATSINLWNSSRSGSHIATRGGDITLTTAPRGFVDIHSADPNGSLLTTLAAGKSGNIYFKTDDLNLASKIIAGADKTVTFSSATTGKAFDLGTNHPVNGYPLGLGNSAFGLTAAEIGNISAGFLQIGGDSLLTVPDFSGYGTVTVSKPISTGATVFIGGSKFIDNSALSAPTLLVLTSGDITGGGSLSAPFLGLVSQNGGVSLTGSVSAANLTVVARESILLTGANHLDNLEKITTSHGVQTDIAIVDSDGGLNIDGLVGADGEAPDTVTILTSGNLTITPDGQVTAAEAILAAGGGLFTNNRGADAIEAGRFLVYAQTSTNSPANRNGLVAAEDTTDHYNLTFGQDPIAAEGSNANAFYYFGPQPASSLSSFSEKDALNLLTLATGVPGGGVATFVPQTRSYSLQSVTPPSVPAGSGYLGWTPISTASVQLQESYQGMPNGPMTQLDMQMVMAGGGQKFTPAQVKLLTPENKFYIAYVGYQKMIADGSLKDADGSIKAHLLHWMPFGADQASKIPSYYVEQMIDAGPLGITRSSDANLGSIKLNGVFKTDDLFQSQYKNLIPPKSNSSVLVVGSNLMPQQGSSLLIPPGLTGSTATLISPNGAALTGAGGLVSLDPNQASILSHNGANIISQDGNSILSHNGANVISPNGGNILSHNGANVISPNGGNVISPNGGNVISPNGGNILSHNGANIISQDGNSIISQDGNSVISHNGGNVISPNGGNILSHNGANLVSTPLSSLAAAPALATANGGSILSHNGANVISPNGGNIISQDGNSVISHNGGNIISQDGNSVISHNGGNVISHNGGN